MRKHQLHEWLRNYSDPTEFEWMCTLLLRNEFPDLLKAGAGGDGGADGVSPSTKTLFAMWCPEHLESYSSKAKTKMKSDLAKLPRAREAYECEITRWVFLCTRGLSTELQTEVREVATAQGVELLVWAQSWIVDQLLRRPEVREQFVPTAFGGEPEMTIEAKMADLRKYYEEESGTKCGPHLVLGAKPLGAGHLARAELQDLGNTLFDYRRAGEFAGHLYNRSSGSISRFYWIPEGIQTVANQAAWRLEFDLTLLLLSTDEVRHDDQAKEDVFVAARFLPVLWSYCRLLKDMVDTNLTGGRFLVEARLCQVQGIALHAHRTYSGHRCRSREALAKLTSVAVEPIEELYCSLAEEILGYFRFQGADARQYVLANKGQ
jgi:hypothetical protein